jgi:hypothetical protein
MKGRRLAELVTVCHWNCLLKHVIERKIKERIEMTGRRARRRKQLLDNL